jgi:arabinofuranosyltransferase
MLLPAGSTLRDRIRIAAALALFGVVLFQTAWLTEDAFVTFRTVDNFVHGYSSTWNVSMRV